MTTPDSTPTAAAPAVTITGFGWRHAGRKRPAITGIDLEIQAGEKVLLLGASGAGKSTLLAGIAGLLGGSDEGEQTGLIRIHGVDPATHRGRVGMVLQDPDAQAVYGQIGDDIAFGLENLCVPREEIWPRVRRALDTVGMDLELSHSTAALSGGQKQRVALAGVLAMEPQVMILDEPTANIDPAGITELRTAVLAAQQAHGATLIIVEHHAEIWADAVDRVIVLHPQGTGVLADGSPQQVFGQHTAALLEAGVWVPSVDIDLPDAPSVAAATPAVLTATELGIGRDTTVQSGLELALPAGVGTCIRGANGTGKTTLAVTLAGLLPPRAGRIVVPGVGEQPHTWKSATLVGEIGMVFQHPEHQFLATTVTEELAIGPRAAGMSTAATTAMVTQLLEHLHLSHLAGAHPFSLSGGEKRRLSVATMLATSPRLLFVDEPTFGQDRRTWLALVELLRQRLQEGTTVVSITHDAEYLRVLGSQVLTLTAQGRS